MVDGELDAGADYADEGEDYWGGGWVRRVHCCISKREEGELGWSADETKVT